MLLQNIFFEERKKRLNRLDGNLKIKAILLGSRGHLLQDLPSFVNSSEQHGYFHVVWLELLQKENHLPGDHLTISIYHSIDADIPGIFGSFLAFPSA